MTPEQYEAELDAYKSMVTKLQLKLTHALEMVARLSQHQPK